MARMIPYTNRSLVNRSFVCRSATKAEFSVVSVLTYAPPQCSGIWKLTRDVHQIDHRHDEHPDQIDEVPVESPEFQIVGGVAARAIAGAHHGQRDDAAENVHEVQPSDG